MYTQCLEAESELHSCCVYTDSSVAEDTFATQSLIAIQPAFQQPDEEELHTFFEQAISDRLIAVNRQLSLISGPLVLDYHITDSHEGLVPAPTCQLPQENGVVAHPGDDEAPLMDTRSLFNTTLQRVIIFGSLALMLVMVGFDLMGLLVLHAR